MDLLLLKLKIHGGLSPCTCEGCLPNGRFWVCSQVNSFKNWGLFLVFTNWVRGDLTNPILGDLCANVSFSRSLGCVSPGKWILAPE